MVSNYERIFAEITKEAERLALEVGVDASALVELAMEIVNLEDQNRTKPIRIRQLVEDRVLRSSARMSETQ